MALEVLRASPRAFKVLIASALIENMAFGLIIPFLTIYMVTEVGIREALAGVILAGYTLSGIPGMIFGGMLVDKVGRRAVLLTSLGLMSLTILMYFYAFDFVTFLLIALADSFVGSLYMPAANAMIADVIPSEKRPEAYSTLRIAWNVGLVFGPAIGAAMVLTQPIKILFVFGALILAVAFFMNLALIPETRPEKAGESVTFRKVIGVAKDKCFLMICTMSGVFFFCLTQFMSTLPVYAVSDLGFSESTAGGIWMVNGIMIVLLQLWVTSRVVMFRRSLVLMAGQLVASGGLALIMFAWDLPSLLACLVILTLGEIVYMSILGAIIADMAPEDKRGIYMGFSGFVQTVGWGGGMFFGLWLLDVLAQRELTWMFFGLVGMISSAAYLTFGRMIGPEKDMPKACAADAQKMPLGH